MNTRQYMIKKMLLDFILINFVINGIFYFLNFKDRSAPMTIGTISSDLMIGLILLGLLASASGFMNIWQDLLKGHVDLEGKQPSWIYRTFPRHTLARVGILTLVVLVIIYPMFSHFLTFVGVTNIHYFIGFLIKTVSAVIAAGFVGYCVLQLVMGDYLAMQNHG